MTLLDPQSLRPLARRFRQDLLICVYGCWVLAAFAGCADPDITDPDFQKAAVAAGALEVIEGMIAGHPTQLSLRR